MLTYWLDCCSNVLTAVCLSCVVIFQWSHWKRFGHSVILCMTSNKFSVISLGVLMFLIWDKLHDVIFLTHKHVADVYMPISLQWQYGASFPQRRSAVFDQSSRGSHQSRRDCGLQDRRQGDPNSTQSTKGPRKVWHDIHIILISTSASFSSPNVTHGVKLSFKIFGFSFF